MLDELADDYAERIGQFRTGIKETFAKGGDTFSDTAINMESLQAYLEFKFPDKPIKREILSLVIHDINRQRYGTIADIDNAVVRAKAFLDWWSSYKPDYFTSGADYITKALGWVDPEFRRNHAFGSLTRKAFDDFSALTRKASP